jgi:tetratricopeptide (TPR) repeat protein
VSVSLSITSAPPSSPPPELTEQINAFIQAGRIEPLADLLLTALARYPNDPELHHLLGWARAQQRRLPEAESHFRDAIRLNPLAAGSFNNLGTVLLDQECVAEAYQAFAAAIRIQPEFAHALANAGFTLGRLGRSDEALPLLEKALQLDPDYDDGRHHLGYILMNLKRFEDSEQQFRLILSRQPNNPAFLNTYGLLREKQHHIEEATCLFEQAIELDPNQAHAWNNLGNIHAAVLGNLEHSLSCFNRTLLLQPHFAFARHHRGLVELALGDFASGWEDYEFRPTYAQKSPDRYRQPRWQREPLAGKTILLHAEQGFGDTLQGIRYARHIKAAGATVVCEVQKPLVPLLSRTPGIDQLLADGEDLPAHDFQIPLLSIPHLLGIPLDEPPYLFASDERLKFWKDRIQSIPGIKVGIAWQGDSTFEYDWLRSIPLAEFAPLVAVPNCHLISLQKYEGVEQVAANRHTVPVIELEPEIDAASGPFMDTAAVMRHLDLVITSDTSIAHLAGGLGVPVWLATSYAPDWRWMMHREDCLWYPTMRLFRQTKIHQWIDVFTRMAHELTSLTSNL